MDELLEEIILFFITLLLIYNETPLFLDFEKRDTSKSLVKWVSENNFALLSSTDYNVNIDIIDISKGGLKLAQTYEIGRIDNSKFSYGETTLRVGGENIVCRFNGLKYFVQFKINQNKIINKKIFYLDDQFENIFLDDKNSCIFFTKKTQEHIDISKCSVDIYFLNLTNKDLNPKKVFSLDGPDARIHDGIVFTDKLVLLTDSGLILFKILENKNIDKIYTDLFSTYDKSIESPQRYFNDKLRFILTSKNQFSFIYRDYFQNIFLCEANIANDKLNTEHKKISSFYKKRTASSCSFFNPIKKTLFLRSKIEGEFKILCFKGEKKIFTMECPDRIESSDFINNNTIATTNGKTKNFFLFSED